MLISNQFTSKKMPAQVLAGAIGFAVLSLPLYLAGYHQGAIPVLGLALAITLGALGVHVVTAKGVAPDVRAGLGAFSLHRTAIWLGLLFLGSFLYASVVLGALGAGTSYELLTSNRYGNPLKPLSHLLYGAGIWSMAQLLMIAHRISVEADTTNNHTSRLSRTLRMRTVIRSFPLLTLGILALFPKATLIVLPLLLIGLIHQRDELLRCFRRNDCDSQKRG